MGKKVKTGKARKDKFYQLAKESGYRSRAAFKLLQLNRQYHFLEKSRVCIDLCAAPGGWLQVAATNMPVSSIIIGVDLAPIRPIGNVITHMEDITSGKCLQLLKKDLSDNKADVVLHDGAPNVGKNWIHDAYQQNILVLQSFKLATEFLKKGGYFVTKVFRSKDYYSLLWVLQQFFKKVDSTKPQASRNESAEIFVVCQNYKAPDKIDPKFFDLKFVFSDVDNDNQMRTANDLFKDDMTKRHRGGYPDNDYTLYHKLNATDFVQKENFLDLLANANEIVLDDKAIEDHEATTTEIKECLKDIRLLGKNDIKTLIKWRLKLKSLYKVKKSEVEKLKSEETTNGTNGKGALENGAENEEEEDIDSEIKNALDSEKKWEKKKKKKLLKEKQKFNKKVNAKLELKDDQIDFHLQGDNELFNLNKIKTNKQLIELQKTLPDLDLITQDDLDDEDDMFNLKKKKKTKSFSKDDDDQSYLENSMPVKKSTKKGSDGEDDNEDNSEFEFSDDDENLNEDLLNGDGDEGEEENPLLEDLTNEDRTEAKKSLTSQWFNKDSFDFLDTKEEENEELLRELDRLEEPNQAVPKAAKKAKKGASSANGKDMARFDGNEEEDAAKSRALNAQDDSDSDSDTDTDEDENQDRLIGKKRKKGKKSHHAASNESKDKLNPVELALGEVITNSKKAKRDLIDESFNRYSEFGKSEDLPEWFVEDEEKNFRKPVVVPKEILNDYRSKDDKINARAIKKVVEAQARKKRRMSKKLDRARKKAEAISDNMDMTNNERVREMKAVYKRAGLLTKKKSEVRYVVGKRGMSTKGLAKSGPYRLVDGRTKKDRRNEVKKAKKAGSKKQAHKKTSNRKTARKQR